MRSVDHRNHSRLRILHWLCGGKISRGQPGGTVCSRRRGRARIVDRGYRGAIAGAIVVGLVEVDSVTIAMARLPFDILSLDGAAYAILAAVAGDTVSKVAIGAVIGRDVSRHRSGS